MGLDYSYRLYFKRDQLWNALQAVVDLAVPHSPPSRVLFPDHELLIPMETWSDKQGALRCDDPQLDFHASFYFERDDAITEYLIRHGNGDSDRSPPDPGAARRLSIGYIYLTIYNRFSEEYDQPLPPDLVLFSFGTTGTRMSILFLESTSIRQTFLELLRRIPGVCGVFNREMGGELIWFDGREYSVEIDDPFALPGEIKSYLDPK
jgi:hypothetical protein